MSRYTNNLVVIGAGSAGLVAANVAATIKAKVTLVERERMGGDCLHTGCVPSKTLIASAKVAHTFADAQRFGVVPSNPKVEFETVMERVRQVIAEIEPFDSVERYTGLGVNCVAGEARLVDGHQVEVDGAMHTAKSVILANGADPFVPPIPGLADISALTSNTLWDLTSLPNRLLVLGGGPIGCELAQAFNRLGSRVTLVEMADRILPLEDPDAAEVLHDVLLKEGIDVRTETKAVAFRAGEATVEMAGQESAIEFDEVLVAVGRRARTEGTDLEAAGVELNPNGTVKVDATLRTTNRSVYGCGDVVGPYQFTHMASHQAWHAAINGIVRPFWSLKWNDQMVPWAIFTDPEIARVGLSEADARERFEDVTVTKLPLSEVDRYLAEGQVNGFVKLVTRGKNGDVLGACIVAHNAGELISEQISSITHGFGLKGIMNTTHVYPTTMEANAKIASKWRRAHTSDALLKLSESLTSILR